MTRSSDPIVDESRSEDAWGEESPSERLSRAVEDRVPGVEPGHDPGTWTSAFRGAEGGFVATVVMTIFRMPVFRALPPTSEFWGQYVGGGPAEEYTVQGFVLHLLYGTVGGTFLGILFPHIDRRSPARTQATALLSGVVYGFVLSTFGVRVVFRHLLDRELDEEDVLVFHVAHAVYGLTIGMWLGKRQSRGETYDSPKAGDETAPAR
jgi:hypothetical protein